VIAGHIPVPHKVELIDVAEPALPSTPPGGETGQIIFQPEIACLCGSDLPYFVGEPPEFGSRVVGHTLHEMVGTVTATNGARFQPGDKVLAVPVGQRGLFERFVVSEQRAIPLDPRIPFEQAVLAQPMGTVIYALKKLPRILDLDFAVVGAGPIGQIFCALLRNLGAREIIAIEKLESRLHMATRMGATAAVNAGAEEVPDVVARLTRGAMVDVVVEAVGHAGQALNACISLVKQGGRILYFGVPPERIDGIAWRDMFYKNVTVHTSVNPDFSRDFPLSMRWLAEGRVDLSPLITHKFALRDIQQAFETFRDRRDGAQKVLVEFPARGRAAM
jgi:threonine dehydrogenase-like Zn-dependent dehydrogenase